MSRKQQQPSLFPGEDPVSFAPTKPMDLTLTFKDHPQIIVAVDTNGKYLRMTFNMTQVVLPASAILKLTKYLKEAGEYCESIGA